MRFATGGFRWCVEGMRRNWLRGTVVGALLLPGWLAAQEGVDFATMLAERSAAVVRVEFFVQRELDRQPSEAHGLVVNDEGLIVLLDSVVPQWLPASQFRDFRVFRPGDAGEGQVAEYLGAEPQDNWHYLRVPPEGREGLKPYDSWGIGGVRVGDEVWGIGLLGRGFDQAPVLRTSRVVILQNLPFPVALSQEEVAGVGGPVFDLEGRFAGWAGLPVTRDRLLYVGGNQVPAGVRAVDESNNFLLAAPFQELVGRVPPSPDGGARSWVGLSGLQPVDRDVARFLGLTGQGALVVGAVVPDGPAERAGVLERDVIVSVDGTALPRFRPDQVVVRWFEREMVGRAAGVVVTLGVARGEERLELPVTLEEAPPNLARARREWIPEIGLTLREFLVYDATVRRLSAVRDPAAGVASFVRPNSPAATAGLRENDWVREVDGRVPESFAQAVEWLRAAANDPTREDVVLLVERSGSETQILRLRVR